MAFYTSPSIILSDSGVAQEPVRRYRSGNLTYEEALAKLRTGYRSWQHDAGCRTYFEEWAATLKALHALRTGDWGDDAATLVGLVAVAGECTPAIAAELALRADTVFADDLYRSVNRSARVVGGDRANGQSHWLMWQDKDGNWSHIGFFSGALGDYQYWPREAYTTLAVKEG